MTFCIYRVPNVREGGRGGLYIVHYISIDGLSIKCYIPFEREYNIGLPMMYQYFNNLIIMIISLILSIELYTRAQKNIPRLIP